MSFSFIASASGFAAGPATTADCTSSLNIQAGDVLVAWCKHEGTSSTFAVAKDSGSPGNAFTFDAGDLIDHANNDLHGSFGYVLSAAADATATFRLTIGASRTFLAFLVLQFRPDSGDIVSKDTSNKATGTSANVNSGNITTSGDDEIAVGGYGDYTDVNTSSEQINGVAATEPSASPVGTTNSIWYRLLTATFSGGAATATITSGEWISGVIAIKSVTGTPAAGTLTQTLPTASTSTTGWTVGTVASGNYSRLSYNNEIASAGFGTTVQPSSGPINGAQDCWRSSTSLYGVFRPGIWTSSVSVIGVTSGGDQDGRVRVNFLKSADPLGASAVTLNTATLVGTTVTNLSTTVAQSSAASAYISDVSMLHEYLFVQTAWEITGAGGASDRDVLVRFGSMSLADGSGLVTSEFSDLTPTGGGGGGANGGGWYFRRRQWEDVMAAMEEL